MKLSKESLFIISIILIIIITVLLLLFPKAINYEYSYVNLSKKKDNINANNNTMIDNETQIKNLIRDLEEMEGEEKEIFEEASKLKKEINLDDFKLDMPSFLISMEQQALKNKVSLNIHYEQMKTIYNDPARNDGVNESESDVDIQEDEDNPEEKIESSENEVESKRDEAENSSEDEDGENEDKTNIEDSAIIIDGMNVTIIPITIKGGYSNIRSYIKYLDEVGMITPTSAKITAEEKELEGEIILNVFHGEVF